MSKDIIQLHISCPSDKEEEKSTKDVSEKEDKDKNKEKVPRRMLSRGEDFTPLICSRAWLFGTLPFHLPTGLIGPAVYGVLLTSLFGELPN